jgi:hypothetical protein
VARSLYGASPADYTVNPTTGAPAPGINFQVFDNVAGTAVTDLKTATSTLAEGSTITSVTSNGSGAYPFYGPDGYTETLWFQGVGTWYGISPTALGDIVAALSVTSGATTSDVSDHETRLATLEAAPGGSDPEIAVQDLLYRSIAEDGITVPDDFPQYINSTRLAAFAYSKSEVDTRLAAKVAQLGTWTQADAVLATGTGAQRFYSPYACTIVQVRANVVTAPTGASLIVDVNKNGTTIYGTQSARPTIAASSVTAVGGAPTVTTLAAGDYLTIDIDQIGSTVAGGILTVQVTVRP